MPRTGLDVGHPIASDPLDAPARAWEELCGSQKQTYGSDHDTVAWLQMGAQPVPFGSLLVYWGWKVCCATMMPAPVWREMFTVFGAPVMMSSSI